MPQSRPARRNPGSVNALGFHGVVCAREWAAAAARLRRQVQASHPHKQGVRGPAVSLSSPGEPARARIDFFRTGGLTEEKDYKNILIS
jgi:hypothetical protein